MDKIKARIEARIAQLSQELDAFVEQANRQISAQQGAIQALGLLLDELQDSDEEE